MKASSSVLQGFAGYRELAILDALVKERMLFIKEQIHHIHELIRTLDDPSGSVRRIS